MVVAHRACWLEGAPENSILAIQECIKLGVDLIEIDVTLTKDGVPVLMHDDTVDRTTDGTGPVGSFLQQDFQKLRLRQGAGGPSAPVTDQIPPTLEEVLRITKDKVLINLDAKEDVFDSAFQLIESSGMENQILMKMRTRSDDPRLNNARFLGQTHFMPIISECGENVPYVVCTSKLSTTMSEFLRFEPVAFEITFQTEEFLLEGRNAIAKSGRRLWVNSLSPHHAAGYTDELALSDPDKHWGRIIELGANMIQTDYPHLLIKFLASRSK